MITSIATEIQKIKRETINLKPSSSSGPSFKLLQTMPKPADDLWTSIPAKIRTGRHFAALTQHLEFNPIAKLTFFVSHDTANTTKDQIVHLIDRMTVAVELLRSYASKQCTQPHLNVFVYLSTATKTLDTPDEIIGPIHANTAFTTSCDFSAAPATEDTETKTETKTIVLFRKEEVFKVLLHELFHVLGLDFSHDQNATRQTADYVRKHFGIRISDIRLFETYCETWATILNCIFMAVEDSTHVMAVIPDVAVEKSTHVHQITGHTSNWESKFRELFDQEKQHTLFQCVKVLRHNRLSFMDIYSISKSTSTAIKTHYPRTKPAFQGGGVRKGSRKTKKKLQKGGNAAMSAAENPSLIKYAEKTQVFCYYILKTAVFLHVDEFMAEFPPPFIPSQALPFAAFVHSCFVDPAYKTQIHKKMKELEKQCPNGGYKSTAKICRTMRQTVVESSFS